MFVNCISIQLVTQKKLSPHTIFKQNPTEKFYKKYFKKTKNHPPWTNP